jgi:hypothetical protein
MTRKATAGLVLLSAIALAAACGGKVTFVSGSTGNGGGGSGGSAPECFAGQCGEACIKCVGDACFNGTCDPNRICQPPGTQFTCE